MKTGKKIYKKWMATQTWLEKKLNFLESKFIDFIIFLLLIVLFFGLVTFLKDNYQNFNNIIQIVILSVTLGGLTFAGGSIQEKEIPEKKYIHSIFRASTEFIVAGFLILSFFLLSNYSPSTNPSCNPSQYNFISCLLLFYTYIVITVIGFLGGPLFLSVGFARFIYTIKRRFYKM